MSNLKCIKYNERFGRLIILQEVPKTIKNRRRFLCKCDCGNLVEVNLNCLTLNNTRSCGCLNSETLIKRNYKHGGCSHESYINWEGMHQRCYNKNAKSFAYYGGRGIAICRRWRKDFWAFVNDIGYKPSKNHTVDRIDNNGPYAPWNCRWATKKQQARNRSDNRLIYYKDTHKILKDLADDLGVNKNTLSNRLTKYNDNIELALKDPIKKQKEHFITFKGETKSLKEWSIYLKIPYHTLYDRIIMQKLTPEESFNNRTRYRFAEIKYKDTVNSLKEWSKILNKNYDTLRYRLNIGMTIEEAFEK